MKIILIIKKSISLVAILSIALSFTSCRIHIDAGYSNAADRFSVESGNAAPSTSALVPVLLETKILSKIFVAVAPAVKTAAAASVMTFVVRSALVSILKVFAISA